MKTQISKLFFVFGATIIYLGLFSPINAQAQQTTFNTMSNDRPTIQVTNYTDNPNCNSCWSTSVSADPGDIISVYIYYHNTGTATANSTNLKLNVNQGLDSQVHNIYGSVGASNANTVNGNATINLSQSESLVFDNYVRWYPNHQNTSAQSLPFGQNINTVLTSSGVNIGNIAPDAPLGSFSTQGSMVVRFRVTNTYVPPAPVQTNCVIDSFTANPTTIGYGYFSTLNWNTTDCNNLTIFGAGLNVSNPNPDGSISTGNLYNPTNTFTIRGYGDNGMVQRTVTVTVTGQPANNCVIDNFYATPSSGIAYGGSTTLYWNTTNCDDVSISNGIGNVSYDGNRYISHLYDDETYTITASGNNTSDAMTITVYVDSNNNNNNSCQIDYFYASPDNIDEGEDSRLYWATTNCDDVNISNGVGHVNNDGNESINNLYDDETYTLTATGNNSSDTMTLTVHVDNGNGNNDCEIDDFYASPDNVDEGDNTTLYWNTTNCDDVSISNGIGNVSDDGHEDTDDLYNDETYTLYASDGNSSDSKTIHVDVNQDNNNNDCEIDDFYASPTSVIYGGSTRLYWETTDCDDVYISNGIGNVSDDGDERISNVYSNTTYTITAHGGNGSDSDSVTVYVGQAPVYESLAVSTIGASGIGRTTATLSGAIAHTGSGTASAWFEYGPTSALGFTTDQSSFYSASNTGFTKSLSGLIPETTYFYRAVASGVNGRVEGEMKYFRTLSTVTDTNTVVYVNSGTGESLVDLNITSAFENVGVGETYDIDIEYLNTSSSVIAKDSTLTVVLPKNLTFLKISRGEYNKTDHTAFVNLEDIDPKEEGKLTIEVKVSTKAQDGELLVTAGTLNYEKSNNKKEEVIDVLTNKVTSDGTFIGAFALGGGFWPSTLIGWLLLLIIFLMIIYIANRMFRRKNVAQPMSVPVPPQTYR